MINVWDATNFTNISLQTDMTVLARIRFTTSVTDVSVHVTPTSTPIPRQPHYHSNELLGPVGERRPTVL
jgi:hypothetical protein